MGWGGHCQRRNCHVFQQYHRFPDIVLSTALSIGVILALACDHVLLMLNSNITASCREKHEKSCGLDMSRTFGATMGYCLLTQVFGNHLRPNSNQILFFPQRLTDTLSLPQLAAVGLRSTILLGANLKCPEWLKPQIKGPYVLKTGFHPTHLSKFFLTPSCMLIYICISFLADYI